MALNKVTYTAYIGFDKYEGKHYGLIPAFNGHIEEWGDSVSEVEGDLKYTLGAIVAKYSLQGMNLPPDMELIYHEGLTPISVLALKL